MNATKIASVFLVPTELIEDTQDFNGVLRQTMWRDMDRRITAEVFGESWYDPSSELDRLEHGRPRGWDRRYYPEDWCDA